jgi:uncharacterized membrane protein
MSSLSSSASRRYSGTIKRETMPFGSEPYQIQEPQSVTRLSETESLTTLARAFYILIIITTIFFLVMLGTIVAVLVNFNNVVLYIAISSGIAFALLLLLTVFIIGMKQFEKAYTQKIY